MYQSKTVDQVGWLLRILRLIARESRIFYYSTKRKSASDEQRTHLSQTCLWWKPQEQPISQMSVIKKQFTHTHTHPQNSIQIYTTNIGTAKKKKCQKWIEAAYKLRSVLNKKFRESLKEKKQRRVGNLSYNIKL